MIIPVDGVDTLADYEIRREYLDKNIRPVFCPACCKEKTFWRHGRYVRKVFAGAEHVAVRINRFKCGNCAIVVSCIFSFMIPYVRYATSVVSTAVQNFSEVETSYVEQASELSDLSEDAVAKPSPAQVFRWVDRVARKAQSLLFQLQKEFVLRNAENLLNGFVAQRAPNQQKARSEQKKHTLQNLAEFVQLARLFTAGGAEAVLQIHAFFFCSVESLQAIFSGRSLTLPTTHSLQSLLC